MLVDEKRTRTADFRKIRECGIGCSRNRQTAIITTANGVKVFVSVDTRSKAPRLNFYTAEESLQW